MTSTTITPVTINERIQTIDILRGIALLGILIINFTVDAAYGGPSEGWTGIADQTVYWSIRFLMDDRFQTIFCFLFGLGFAIQAQRAEERNVPFTFIFLRRMLGLFLIGCAFHIFFRWSLSVLPFYAIIGLWLLLFRKIPAKFLPLLAIFFFCLAFTADSLMKNDNTSEVKIAASTTFKVDSTILDKYVGVYQNPQNQRVIIMRNGDSLIGESPTKHFNLAPLSDSQFFRQEMNTEYTFMKSSSGDVDSFKVVYIPTGQTFFFKRLETDLQEALMQQLESRADAIKGLTATETYWQLVKVKFDGTLTWLKTFPWQKFLWKGNYEVGYILVLFILGLYAGRKKLFFNVTANKQVFERVLKRGLIVGTPLIIFSTGFDIWNFSRGISYWDPPSKLLKALFHLIWFVEVTSLSLAYIAGLTLFLENESWKKRLSFFAVVGRLGLTNFGLHLLAYTLIFERVEGLWGLDGKVGSLYRLLISIIVYGLLYFFSRWWLSRFTMGPFEWLWRSMTYWKWQPIKKKETAALQVTVV